jgi:two-component system chemotaxis sensor kinase CheA
VETAEAETADLDTPDLDVSEAGEMSPSESLDESAQSFGEGGLDLSEESDSPAAEAEDVAADAEELDLDDSFGEMEADVAEEAASETDDGALGTGDDAPEVEESVLEIDEETPGTGAADDAGDEADDAAAADAFDLGEDDIDFGEGTVAGAEDAPADADDEGVAVGGALEDDSFGDDVTADELAADAEVGDDTVADESVEPVDGFGGDEDALDLDGAVAGSDATSPADEAETFDDPAVDDLLADAELDDDAGFEADDDAPLDAGAGDADAAAGATPSTDFDDPGFSDEPEAADDGPEIDEERLERIRTLGVPARDGDAEAGAATTQSIRVDVDSLDRMLNLVEGLVTSRARLRRALIENEPREVLEDELDDLEDVTSELQDTVMDVRLVPLRTAVNKLPRIVRDVAREQDKEVAFEMAGEDVELDRSILDEIGDPLVHLVRNAVDHGIEAPGVREEAGKDPEGSVELRAIRERDRVTIEVEDDGAGIDADAVRDAAVEEGIHTRSEVDSMDDADVHDLIFHAGFSTASEVTDVSGRGVGMDVVAETVDRLDGTVSVDSEVGEGTTITMELPVTLAIAEVLFVDVGGEEYGIPIKTVDEIGPVVGVETQDGQEVLVSDGGENERELIRLDDALSTPGRSDPNSGMLVHLRDDVREAAIHCDSVREQQEVVVKPFEGVLGDVPGIGGASVLGDGDVVNILDVETL